MEALNTPFFVYEILLCFLLSIFFFNKVSIEDKAVPFFFFFLLCIEYYCALLNKRGFETDYIYNFWFPIEYCFYSLFIASYITRSGKIKLSRSLVIAYLLFTVVYYSLNNNLRNFSSLCYLCGFIVLLLTMLFKFYEILNQEIIYNPLKNEIFWFMMGLLIVNLGSFFRFGAANYIYKSNKELHSALQVLNVYLTEVQYLFFIIFFFLRWKKQNSHT